MRIRSICSLLSLGFFALFITACSDDVTPESQVRSFIQTATEAAENRDALDLKELIAKDYSDDHGLNKTNLVRMAAGYFLRNRNIHLLTRIHSIDFPIQNQAKVTVYVAMAGHPVSAIDSLTTLRAQLYRFDLQLIHREAKWLIRSAHWQQTSLQEFIKQ